MVKSIQTAGYNGVPTVGEDFYVRKRNSSWDLIFFLLLLQTESLCGTLCNRTVYYNRNNFISEFVMGNERKVFGDGYCVVWAFYSSLYVFEKVEHYSFNFDNIIYATGGNMGLFLGWSLKSIFIDFIEFLYQNLKKNTQT